MSLLESMRSGTDSTFMQVVLGVLVVSFVFWYAAPQGDIGSVVANVDGEIITGADFRRNAGQRVRQIEQSRGTALSDEEQVKVSLEVRDQMIERELIVGAGTRMGIEISDTEIARRLLSIDAFKDGEGKFDDRIYTNTLRRMNHSRDTFEESLRSDLMSQKVRQMVAMGIAVSDANLKTEYVRANTTVDVEFVLVTPMRFRSKVDVTAESVATYLSESEAVVQEKYDADFERRYNIPAKVDLAVIRLAVLNDGIQAEELKERLSGIKAELDGGADFTELAAKYSEDTSAGRGGRLGSLNHGELAPDVSSAVDGLEVGGISEIVSASGEIKIFKVMGKSEAMVTSFDDVKEKIAEQQIREQAAPALAAQFAEELLKKWSESNEVPQAMLDANGLSSQFSGPTPIGGGASPFAPPPELFVEAGQKAADGVMLSRVFERDGNLYVGRVGSFIAADMTKYEDDLELLTNQVLNKKRSEIWQAWMDDLRANASITTPAIIQ